MFTKRRIALIVALALSLSLCRGATARSAEENSTPEVDRLAVLRCGDQVQHVTGIQEGPDDEFVEIMGSPPPDDSHKWFISVLTTDGCAPCAQLKNDWEQNPWLLALANPQNPKESWAHYNVYQARDKSQDFRFQDIRVAGYPTILVQPPRNGRYGSPKTIVFQSTYSGDPQELASKITASIRLYLQRQHPPSRIQHPPSSIGQAPLFLPPNQSPTPDGWPNLPPPEKTPETNPPEPASGITLIGILTAGVSGAATMFLLTVVAPWALRTIREQRAQSGQKLLLNDDQFAILLKLLETSKQSSNN